ncbi:LOW QUALITY PROTEIN: hypothetical protein RJ641_023308 [Dillenia turbinata]|uniref:Uncharacterized protein n=1 Tax=Dillenia turbinata TaxID=194707 RepID=A0AAN8U9A5_9MAGN
MSATTTHILYQVNHFPKSQNRLISSPSEFLEVSFPAQFYSDPQIHKHCSSSILKPPRANSTTETSKNNPNKNNYGDDNEVEKHQKQLLMIKLDDVNPGRKSRQIFDEVWRKFSILGQISRTIRSDDESTMLIRKSGPMCEFAIPGAQNSTVLVVAATSRVGRIVAKKLTPRGYTVKALVKKADK